MSGASSYYIGPIPQSRWQDYRDLRLEALQTDPEAFGSNPEREKEFDEAEWKRRMTKVFFAIPHSADTEESDPSHGQLVGMVGVIPEAVFADGLATTGFVVSVWTRPAFRRRGIAAKMMTWITQHYNDPEVAAHHRYGRDLLPEARRREVGEDTPVSKLSLQVEGGNVAAQKLYEALGFVQVSRTLASCCNQTMELSLKLE